MTVTRPRVGLDLNGNGVLKRWMMMALAFGLIELTMTRLGESFYIMLLAAAAAAATTTPSPPYL